MLITWIANTYLTDEKIASQAGLLKRQLAPLNMPSNWVKMSNKSYVRVSKLDAQTGLLKRQLAQLSLVGLPQNIVQTYS